MVSYVTQEIADEGLIADSSGYLVDGSMAQEGSILVFNCTLALNLTTEASGGEVVVPILANGSVTHFQWCVSACVRACVRAVKLSFVARVGCLAGWFSCLCLRVHPRALG